MTVHTISGSAWRRYTAGELDETVTRRPTVTEVRIYGYECWTLKSSYLKQAPSWKCWSPRTIKARTVKAEIGERQWSVSLNWVTFVTTAHTAQRNYLLISSSYANDHVHAVDKTTKACHNLSLNFSFTWRLPLELAPVLLQVVKSMSAISFAAK